MTSQSAPEVSVHALRLQGVGRRFGALEAVRDVTIDIAIGERRAVLGPNGAGKTTLFNTIAGDYPPTSGRVVLFGEDITNLPPHQRTRRGLARTYQTSLLLGGLSVRDNIYLGVRGVRPNRLSMRRPKPSDEDHQTVDELAETVGLSDVIATEVDALSHGQQRQLEIAMALSSKPRLLMLDEPAAGLSPSERGDLLSLLNGFPRTITIILIEHDMDVALRAVDQVTVMHNGSVIAEGGPEEIQHNQVVLDIYLGAHSHE